MPGESSGFACRGPLEQSNSTRVGKVHFLAMTTPFERAGSGNRRGETSRCASYGRMETESQKSGVVFRIAARLEDPFSTTAERQHPGMNCRRRRCGCYTPGATVTVQDRHRDRP